MDKFSNRSKTMNRTQGTSNQKNGFTFTPTQILTNQILKVIKLRLRIANIHIPEEKLIELIKDNLSLIDIRYFKVSSLNIFVDDLINIIKKEKEFQQPDISEKDESLSNQSTSTSERTTILSFNRKVYDDTNNVHFTDEQPKKQKIQKTPMRFNLDNKSKPDEIDFYLDGNEKKEITILNDCDLEEIQENIIAEIAKEFDKNN